MSSPRTRQSRALPASISPAALACLGMTGLFFMAGCGQDAAAPLQQQAEQAAAEAAQSADAAMEGAQDAAADAQNAAATAQDAAADAKEAVGQAASDAAAAASAAGEQLNAGFTAAMDKATSALEGVEGGPELLTKVKDFFASARDTLGGVTDSDSAQEAVAKFGDLDKAVDGLSEMIGKLPESARPAVNRLIEQGTEQLKKLSGKVMAIPGVSNVIKPHLDGLMEKLTALTASPPN